MTRSIDQIDDLSHVEKELEDLQSLIRQHFGVMAGLTDMQPQLKTLGQFQETWQTAHRQTETVLQQLQRGQLTLSDRTDKLERQVQQLTDDYRQIKRTMEQVLADCAAEWAQQQQSIQGYLQEFEARTQNDIHHAINRLSRTGVDGMAQRERLERLDTRVRGLSSSVKSINNTLKTWSGLAILISIVGFLGIVVLMMVFGGT